MTAPGTTALYIAYPAGAWATWGAWMLGIALGWALLVGLATALVVLVPWALRTLAASPNTKKDGGTSDDYS